MTFSVLMYALMLCTFMALAGIFVVDGVRALARRRTRVPVAAPSSHQVFRRAHGPQPR